LNLDFYIFGAKILGKLDIISEKLLENIHPPKRITSLYKSCWLSEAVFFFFY